MLDWMRMEMMEEQEEEDRGGGMKKSPFLSLETTRLVRNSFLLACLLEYFRLISPPYTALLCCLFLLANNAEMI